MGHSQSHTAFFQPEPLKTSESVDVFELLYNIERKLWRQEPKWLQKQNIVLTTSTSTVTAELLSHNLQSLTRDPRVSMVRNITCRITP